MNVIIALIISLSALVAPSLPSTPAQPFTLPAALNVTCMEDEPCWDCHVMGNHTCDVTTDDTTADALLTLDAFQFAPNVATTVEYSRTLDNDVFKLDSTEFALQSLTVPTHWHIFQTAPTDTQGA